MLMSIPQEGITKEIVSEHFFMEFSMAPFDIRKARADDLDFICKCNLHMAKETENKTLEPDTVRAGVKAVLENPSRGFYLIAEHHNYRVGQLMVTFEWSDWRNGMFWWIQSVFVLEEQRRKGVFSALFHSLKSLAMEQGSVCGLRLYAMESNKKAHSTYLNMGMEQTEYLMFEKHW